MKNITIYTWSFCPFCIRAKQLLDSKDILYKEIIIDGDKQALNDLTARTNCKSVPQIFVDDVFIGGCDDIHRLDDEGRFDALFL